MLLILKRKMYLSSVLAIMLLGFVGGSQAAGFGSNSESSMIGSSMASQAYWWAGVDLYKPLSRSRNVDLFQNSSLQGSGEFDDRDFEIGLSVVRYWGPLFLSVGLGGPMSSTETALREILHGSNLDTSVKLKRNVFGTVMLGYAFNPYRAASLSVGSSLSLESFSFLRQLTFELAGGVMISRDELIFKSDETVGGGVPERKREDDTEFEPVVEAAIKVPTKAGGDFRLGVMGYRVGGTTLRHESSTFSFPYEVDVESGWQWDLKLSYGYKF